jgi:hypothetical protein
VIQRKAGEATARTCHDVSQLVCSVRLWTAAKQGWQNDGANAIFWDCKHSRGPSLAVGALMASDQSDAALASNVVLALAYGVLVLAGLYARFSGSHREQASTPCRRCFLMF